MWTNVSNEQDAGQLLIKDMHNRVQIITKKIPVLAWQSNIYNHVEILSEYSLVLFSTPYCEFGLQVEQQVQHLRAEQHDPQSY